MEIPFKRVVWNEHEAVLLVDTFEKVRDGVVSRDKAIVNLSKRLRNRMVLDGIVINEKYRNVAGMDLQLLSLERSVDSYGCLVENNHLSHTFCKIYLLSRNDREAYNAMLSDANMLYPEISNEVMFSNGSLNTMHSYEAYEIEQTNSFVNEEKDVEYKASGSFMVESPIDNSLPKSNLAPISHAFKTININVEENVLAILAKNFSNGYRLNSLIARKRFAMYYTKEYGKNMDIYDDQMDAIISKVGIVYNGMVYAPSKMIDETTKQSLFDYIENQFANGIVCIYYNVLFEHFSQQFLGQIMVDGEMLRYYLEFYNIENKYHFDEEYFSQEMSANIDINQVVIDYVKAQGGCVTEDEVSTAFEYLPREKVIEAFSSNRQKLVLSSMKTRFHIDNFQLEEIDKIVIVDFLSKEIASMQYVTFSELFGKIAEIAPRVIENNIQFTQTGIRTALSCLLSDKFHIIGGFISGYDNSVSAYDAFINLGRGRESFNISEVEVMANDFNVPINFEALAVNNVRVSEDIFVSKDYITFDTELVDKAISRFCQNEFISILDVNTFTAFPECGYRWTPYLLESYLYSYSKMFILKHKAFNKTSVAGAIVRKNSCFTDYLNIMALALANADIPLDEKSSLDFLAQNGYIERRRLNTINEVIRKAEKMKLS
ncbi:hypothetical protein [Bacteroides sp.]|uniref:hypothetical protein n=1 Tax=Bacteroides sp. TaxID=29523 RepID=UPI0025C1DB1F|nr:hypothetical protein [Bacteroides sp.]